MKDESEKLSRTKRRSETRASTNGMYASYANVVIGVDVATRPSGYSMNAVSLGWSTVVTMYPMLAMSSAAAV